MIIILENIEDIDEQRNQEKKYNKRIILYAYFRLFFQFLICLSLMLPICWFYIYLNNFEDNKCIISLLFDIILMQKENVTSK